MAVKRYNAKTGKRIDPARSRKAKMTARKTAAARARVMSRPDVQRKIQRTKAINRRRGVRVNRFDTGTGRRRSRMVRR
jgi:hypothetical protein